ncbi:MAG TPA: hypothetical protein VFR58_11015 [Flavisolibacter sp.]|nr:hypothetical protein [Flavisolibacter sp.]
MKRILAVGIMMMLLFDVDAQSPAQELSEKIADRMKDSLSLSDGQRQAIVGINNELNMMKLSARRQYAGTDSLSIKIRKAEGARDSLYGRVLTSAQMMRYQEIKTKLVNNN